MTQPHTADAPAQIDSEGRFWSRYHRGIDASWTVVVYLIAAAGVLDTYFDNPAAMRGWPLAGLIGLVAAYLMLYRWFFAVENNRFPLRRVVLYGCAQLAIVVLLAQYNLSFVGLLYVVLAHLLATLPYRTWPLPIIASLLVVYFFWDVHTNIVQQNFDDAFFTILQPLTWVLVIASIAIVTRKSYEQTKTVRELRRARAQLEAGAAQAEELAVLRERARLAREFHDNVGHALVVVNVKLEAAQRLYAREPARGDAELEQTRELVRQTMAELRRSLADLRAPLTMHHDLAAALQQLADELEARSPLRVAVEVAPELKDFEPRVAEALWLIAREALANVERHAGAASATIGLERHDNTLVLRISDDGIGISAADRRKPQHYGLLGMHERVEAVGGTLTIGRGPSGGTIVEARIDAASAAGSAAIRVLRLDGGVGVGHHALDREPIKEHHGHT